MSIAILSAKKNKSFLFECFFLNILRIKSYRRHQTKRNSILLNCATVRTMLDETFKSFLIEKKHFI